jgi:putative ABC transport system permease protein
MLKSYILIACKVLLRRKFFTFISLTGISLTLMVLIVYSAFFENLLGKVPPETKCERILSMDWIQLFDKEGPAWYGSPGYQFLTEYIKIHTLPRIECASVFSNVTPVATIYKGRMLKTRIKRTDGNFWKILDFEFVAGRPLTADDEKNAQFVAVINNSMRKRLFGKNSGIGERITVDSHDYRVVGVVKDVAMIRRIPFAEIWIPLSTAKSGAYRTGGIRGEFRGMVLVNNHADIPSVRREYQARVSRFDYPHSDRYIKAEGSILTNYEFAVREILGDKFLNRAKEDYIPSFLTGVMILFLILPTLNLVNINLSRILERSSEIGVRKAFGASSRVLAGQFLVENMVTTLIGGCIGFALSFVVIHAVNSTQLIPYAALRFHSMVYLYGLIAILLFGILSGVYPAWKMSRYHPVEALRRNPM